MNLEKIKKNKIQEAIEFYKSIGILKKDKYFSEQENLPISFEPQIIDNDTNIELQWTRLSNSSNNTCFIE